MEHRSRAGQVAFVNVLMCAAMKSSGPRASDSTHGSAEVRQTVRVRGGKQAAWVCATAVLMSGKVWPIQGTAGTVAERLAGSLQVRWYIMSCEQVGNSVVGSVVVSKT